jgi:hypothetical protein
MNSSSRIGTSFLEAGSAFPSQQSYIPPANAQNPTSLREKQGLRIHLTASPMVGVIGLDYVEI